MGLSCSCDYDDYDGALWIYYPPKDYSTLETSKRKRCCSCYNLIDIGSTVLAFPRYRGPRSLVEDKIFGDDYGIPMADRYMCEQCGDLYLSIVELGFCISTTPCLLNYSPLFSCSGIPNNSPPINKRIYE